MTGDRNFLFVLSPNAGILDSWLPVLDRLARLPHVKIHAILPRPRATLNLRRKDFMIRSSAETFASVHFCTADGRWNRARSLVHARRKLVLTNWGRRLLKNRVTGQPRGMQDDPTLDHEATRSYLEEAGMHRPTAMLCDISEARKPYFSGLLQSVPQAKIHSVSQAVSLQEFGDSPSTPTRVPFSGQVQERIETQFLLSESEARHYSAQYGLSNSQISVSGIFRHDPQWIAQAFPRARTKGLQPGSYLFLASRPTSPKYLPHSEKQRVIAMTHEQARKNGLTLVVRRHPFEPSRRQFDQLLGKPGKKNNWLETARHSMDVGFECAFAITLNSSVAIDMAAMGVPVIDPVDYRTLRDDSPTIRFDDRGRPISSYSKSEIAIGASDESSFSAAAGRLSKQGGRSVAHPSKAYRALYADPAGAIQSAVQRILNADRS